MLYAFVVLSLLCIHSVNSDCFSYNGKLTCIPAKDDITPGPSNASKLNADSVISNYSETSNHVFTLSSLTAYIDDGLLLATIILFFFFLSISLCKYYGIIDENHFLFRHQNLLLRLILLFIPLILPIFRYNSQRATTAFQQIQILIQEFQQRRVPVEENELEQRGEHVVIDIE
jgi:putative effector of murein hydrolase LrgA (UPF0299 family)